MATTLGYACNMFGTSAPPIELGGNGQRNIYRTPAVKRAPLRQLPEQQPLLL